MDAFGSQKLPMDAKQNLYSLLQGENFDVLSVVSDRNEAIRLVDTAKVNNLYQQSANRGQFESKLTVEDLNDSFKKALIAL